MGQIQSFDEFLNFLLRRRFLIAAITAIGVLIAVVVALRSVPVFEATAAIQVQRAQIGTPSNQINSAQLIQSLEQRLTARRSLLDMIERHTLYTELPLTDEEKVALLRQSVRFERIEEAGQALYGQPPQVGALLITVQAQKPEQAARLANDFAQALLDLSSDQQLYRARETFTFYDDEVVKLMAEITGLETAITEHKNQHTQALPTTAAARRDDLVNLDNLLRILEQQKIALQSEQLSLAQSGETLRQTDKRRQSELEHELTVIEAQKSALSEARDDLHRTLAQLPDVERVLTGLERQLFQTQELLTALSTRRAEAQANQRLAERQQGDRFALLDRAITPATPTGGSRKKIVMAGAIVALLAGMGAAFLLDLRHPVVRNSAQLQRQLGITPLMSLPALPLVPTPRRQRRSWWPIRQTRP